MTHRTRNTLIGAASLVAASPPIALWFLLMAKFPVDVSTARGWAVAILFLCGAFLAPSLAFVCGFLTANWVYNITASRVRFY